MMTVEEQKLVEKNHNLIYDFAKRKNLVIDEYYDILAIGLCKAAMAYDSSKGEFSTIANTCMNNELNNHWKHMNINSKIPEDKISSYDAPVNLDSGDSIIDTLFDNYNLVDDVLSSITYSSLLDLLTDKEKLVVQCMLEGLTQNQIAEKLNHTRRNVCYIIKRIKQKWSVFVSDY